MNRKAMGGLVVAGALLIGAPAWSAAQDAPRASHPMRRFLTLILAIL